MIIHLVGAQHTNYPWGFENRLISAIRDLGHTLISTDFRQERPRLPELLQQKADLMLVCKGEGIDPHLIESSPCVTALWYAEQVGTPDRHDETALVRRQELAFNMYAFDYVFSHDPSNLLVYKRLGGEHIFPLPCAAVDPAINRKVDLPKKYDVVFVGSKTERRQNLLTSLSQRGVEAYSPNLWNAEEMNRLFNESRIVLNLHLSDFLNTETRVAEVLGAGSFLLSETLSDPDLVESGKHFVECAPGDIEELADKAKYYLGHEVERETIAQQGYDFIQKNHTYAHRIQSILETVDFSMNHRIWPAYSIGVPVNRQGKPTLRLDRYNAHVRELLRDALHISGNDNPSPTTHVEQRAKKGQRPLRIFAAFAHVNWEEQNLLPAWQSFGDVYHFHWNFDDQYDPNWHRQGKADMNIRMVQTLEREHQKHPFDLFFGYLSGRLIFPGYIRYIKALGIPTLNLCLDDTGSFMGRMESTGWSGMIDLASAFDLCMTNAKQALPWYEQSGGRAIYLPSGANGHIYKSEAASFDTDVSFIGQCYGERPKIIDILRSAGIAVQTFGRGWPSGEITVSEMVAVYNRSRINLGFAMVQDRKDTFCLKGRDFEVPMAGGLYFTQYHEALRDVYAVGKEVVCFHDVDDLIEKIRHYLAHPDEAEVIRQAGYQRARNSHTWEKRFETALTIMNISQG